MKIPQLCPILCDPMDCIHGILYTTILKWVAVLFSREPSHPRDWTQVSHIVGRFFTAKPQGKPKNTGMSSLSLLQRIFPAQEYEPGSPCIAGRYFTNWAVREAPLRYDLNQTPYFYNVINRKKRQSQTSMYITHFL